MKTLLSKTLCILLLALGLTNFAFAIDSDSEDSSSESSEEKKPSRKAKKARKGKSPENENSKYKLSPFPGTQVPVRILSFSESSLLSHTIAPIINLKRRTQESTPLGEIDPLEFSKKQRSENSEISLLETLPNDIINIILDYLSFSDSRALFSSCRKLSQSKKLIKKVTLENFKSNQGLIHYIAKNCPKIEEVVFSPVNYKTANDIKKEELNQNNSLTAFFNEIIGGSFKELKEINLPMTDKKIFKSLNLAIVNLKNLTCINLDNARIFKESVEFNLLMIKIFDKNQFPNLKVISLNNKYFSQVDTIMLIRVIESFRIDQISHLSFNIDFFIKDKESIDLMKSLVKLNIKSIKMVFNSKFKDETIMPEFAKAIEGGLFRNIKNLNIENKYYRIENKDLELIKNAVDKRVYDFSQLEKLILYNESDVEFRFLPVSFILSQNFFPRLHSIILDNQKLNQDDYALITNSVISGNLPQLKSFELMLMNEIELKEICHLYKSIGEHISGIQVLKFQFWGNGYEILPTFTNLIHDKKLKEIKQICLLSREFNLADFNDFLFELKSNKIQNLSRLTVDVINQSNRGFFDLFLRNLDSEFLPQLENLRFYSENKYYEKEILKLQQMSGYQLKLLFKAIDSGALRNLKCFNFYVNEDNVLSQVNEVSYLLKAIDEGKFIKLEKLYVIIDHFNNVHIDKLLSLFIHGKMPNIKELHLVGKEENCHNLVAILNLFNYGKNTNRFKNTKSSFPHMITYE